MSLDVYLNMPTAVKKRGSSSIFIREDGGIKELSYSEWKERFPLREPLMLVEAEIEDTEVYWANITHNLNTMASKAGIYKHLWRPEELGVELAADLIEPLEQGLSKLREDPDYYRGFNPKNGWGNYDGLVRFVDNYLQACKEYPDAEIGISR